MSKIETIKAEFETATGAVLEQLGKALSTFTRAVADEVIAGQHRAIAARADDENIALDNALFDSAPVAAVPRHAEFAPLLDVGHRFLLAAEGLFVEIRRPWLHLIQQVAPIEGACPRPPYGSIDAKIEFAFGRISAAEPHLRRFATDAAGAAPNEHAAWIVWNETSKELVYREVEVTSSTPTAITINRPALADDESLAFDLHSHGAGPAGFSATDDADDAGEVKIAGVIGGVGTANPSVAFRLCALGKMITLRVPVQAFFPSTEKAA
ncbi:PRTRC system protein A [Burkholderia vietnamiensis]|uniref:PRTRC system protein A n=1 Tax=Burkholderia vietnamiensis TaxID=60552 RepID=UPI001FC8AB2C|nr:PRTRC system protein A [Burkholderia vietnamiensis]